MWSTDLRRVKIVLKNLQFRRSFGELVIAPSEKLQSLIVFSIRKSSMFFFNGRLPQKKISMTPNNGVFGTSSRSLFQKRKKKSNFRKKKSDGP